MNLETLATETRNQKTMNLDTMSVMDILKTMNEEDARVPLAVQKALPTIEKAVKEITHSFEKGGRLIYMGAGTSGRLGVLDAAECVPTFGTEPEQVQGIIAGGMEAMTVAVEGAEDSETLAKEDLRNLNLTNKDTVVGIAASGRTPYVIGALQYAKEIGAPTVTLACNQEAKISQYADYAIEVEVGPEVLTGSTRLKAGTAQKLVLNMLSTVSMIGIGKVYKNLMVDVKPTNEKLVERAHRIIMEATDCTRDVAHKAFVESNEEVKLAIMMILSDCELETAKDRLKQNNGFIRHN